MFNHRNIHQLMNKRFLVSIISKHTLPNFLVAVELANQYDEHLLLVTPAMEQNASLFLEALSDNKTVHILKVDESNIISINEVLQTQNFHPEDEFIINLTGGTKILSLGVYSFFMKHRSWFVYVPYGQNKIMDLRNDVIPINYRVSLSEYLKLYGLTYEDISEDEFLKSKKETFALLEKLRKKNMYLNYDPRIRAAKSNDPDISNSVELSATERKYFSGQWFEEYIYYFIRDKFDLSADDIAMGLKLYRNEEDLMNDNELDIAFMKDNKLHVIECKSGLGTSHKYLSKSLFDVMYKSTAIAKDMGLEVSSYLAVLENISGTLNTQALEALEKRKTILGIRQIWEKTNFIHSNFEF